MRRSRWSRTSRWPRRESRLLHARTERRLRQRTKSRTITYVFLFFLVNCMFCGDIPRSLNVLFDIGGLCSLCPKHVAADLARSSDPGDPAQRPDAPPGHPRRHPRSRGTDPGQGTVTRTADPRCPDNHNQTLRREKVSGRGGCPNKSILEPRQATASRTTERNLFVEFRRARGLCVGAFCSVVVLEKTRHPDAEAVVQGTIVVVSVPHTAALSPPVVLISHAVIDPLYLATSHAHCHFSRRFDS